MDEVPDEHLGEILPLAKKLAKAMGLVDYNILQVSNSSESRTHIYHLLT